jgi:hypothetical protein
MKKLILTGILAVAGLTATANAQIQKGNWMVGSSLQSNFGLNKEVVMILLFSQKELISLKIICSRRLCRFRI